MGEVVYRSQVRVVRERGPLRVAEMTAGERVAFGMHGDVAAHYGRDLRDLPTLSTTLDHVVAAAAG